MEKPRECLGGERPCLAGYALIAFLYLGRPLLQGGREHLFVGGYDAQIFIWSFA
jgi:hypothetical protein